MGVTFQYLTIATWMKGRNILKHFYNFLKIKKLEQYELEKKKKKKRSGKEAAHTRRRNTEEQGTKREATPASSVLEPTEIIRDLLDFRNKLVSSRRHKVHSSHAK